MYLYSTKILLDSIGPAGVRLTTWELTYPRFVHAELMTHRVFSRNSASSRAIPVSKMLERIRSNPAIPVFWGKNQKGMQAAEELAPRERTMANRLWVKAMESAANFAEFLSVDLDVHKQIANRITEPWMFITVIVSSTSFENWFRLRHHKDAQPEVKWVAEDMLPKYRASNPQALTAGEWHMPMLEDLRELKLEGYGIEQLKAISAGRIARVSYLTHDGRKAPQEDIDLGSRLAQQNPPHMSPLEHVAMAMSTKTWNDEVQRIVHACTTSQKPFNPMLLGNFTAWLQYRKEFPNEHGFNFNLQELP